MAQIVRGTIDPETGNRIEGRAIASPLIVPKIESTLEKENIGFWDAHFDWVQGPGDIYDFWTKGQGAEAIGKGADVVAKAGGAVGRTLTGGLGKITLLALLVAAIVVVPRLMPRR